MGSVCEKGGSSNTRLVEKKKKSINSSIWKLTVVSLKESLFFDFKVGRDVQDFHAYLNNP